MIRFDGADVSHYQSEAGPIHWPTLRTVSSWVATKATQHTGYVDPYLGAHRAQMATQGFKHRGLYHWLSPQRKWLWGSFAWRPEDQAAHFLRTIGPLEPGEFVMLDAEEGGITAADVLTWCEIVEAVTHRPVSVYTGAYVAGGTIWQSTSIRHSDYGPRPMHLAAYTSEAKALALPGVAAYPWSAWQYSSNGPVPGVVGRCDMNRVDLVEHYDIAAGVVVEPPPVPPPNPPQEDDLMPYVIFELQDADAALYGQADKPGGVVAVVYWSGADRDAWEAARKLLIDFGDTELRKASVGNFKHARFIGALPTGDTRHTWNGEEFLNAAELRDANAPVSAVDETARKMLDFIRAEVDSLSEREDTQTDRFERYLQMMITTADMLRTAAGG